MRPVTFHFFLHMHLVIFAVACTGITRPSVIADRLPSEATIDCKQTTILDLWSNPWPYKGQRVCLTGFLGRMVKYGEDGPDLFATKAEAANRKSRQFLSLGVPMDLLVQKDLALNSERKLDVVGVFEFDARCWPTPNGIESKFKCSPPRPMSIRQVSLAFSTSE
jgi:hypothetical protein